MMATYTKLARIQIGKSVFVMIFIEFEVQNLNHKLEQQLWKTSTGSKTFQMRKRDAHVPYRLVSRTEWRGRKLR